MCGKATAISWSRPRTSSSGLRTATSRMTDKVTQLPSAEGSVLHLRLCPYCKGVEPALSACAECDGAGLFDQDSQPFRAPAPFDRWTPPQLAALATASAMRGPHAPLNEKPRRLTQAEIVERLLHALNRGGQEHSTIELSRNAKGDTQIRVSVRTGE